MAANPTFELETLTQRSLQHEDSSQPVISRNHSIDEENRLTVQLKPADGGFTAWRLLCAAFVFEALLWGKYSFSSIYSHGCR